MDDRISDSCTHMVIRSHDPDQTCDAVTDAVSLSCRRVARHWCCLFHICDYVRTWVGQRHARKLYPSEALFIFGCRVELHMSGQGWLNKYRATTCARMFARTSDSVVICILKARVPWMLFLLVVSDVAWLLPNSQSVGIVWSVWVCVNFLRPFDGTVEILFLGIMVAVECTPCIWELGLYLVQKKK